MGGSPQVCLLCYILVQFIYLNKFISDILGYLCSLHLKGQGRKFSQMCITFDACTLVDKCDLISVAVKKICTGLTLGEEFSYKYLLLLW